MNWLAVGQVVSVSKYLINLNDIISVEVVCDTDNAECA